MKKYIKNVLRIIIAVAIICIFCALTNKVFGVNADKNTKAYFLSKISRGYGQADCILIENTDDAGNKVFGLIDTGTPETGKYMVNYLIEKGVDELQFVILTHNHGDHTGGMTELLNSDIAIKKIFYKSGDTSYLANWDANVYKNIIKKAVEKQIPIYGSYLPQEVLAIENKDEFKNILNEYQDCVVGNHVIKNDSEFVDFLYNNKTAIMKKKLLNKIDEENSLINLGDATLKLYNWEIFDEKGNVWTKESKVNREVVKDDNNNSIVALLTQGTKKALFTGDMNNLDENQDTGRIGDETRLKDEVGDVDFLKLGHHGYQNSNTIAYLETIKPEYAIITNDIGNAYVDTIDWLEENKVEYYYSTEDSKSMIVTMTDNDIGLNFETLDEFKNINGSIKFLRDEKAISWKEIDTNLNYTSIYKVVNNWNELKKVIEENKLSIKYNDKTKEVEGEKLFITLSSKGTWNANSKITIDIGQDITILPEDTNEIIINRNNSYLGNIINVKGTLTLGSEDTKGKLIFDGGDKKDIIAEDCIITCDNGIVNLYNVDLQNNNRINNKENKTNDYNTYGSAVYICNYGTLNMYGGNIVNNTANNTSSIERQNQNTNTVTCVDTCGVGICSVLGRINISGGTIENNVGKNSSSVKLNSIKGNWYLSQKMTGIGIYAYKNSRVNISNDTKIINNKAINNAVTNMTESNGTTLNRTIYGIGMDIDNSHLNIQDSTISDNTGNNNSVLVLEKSSNIQTFNSTVRGGGIYTTISNANIKNVKIENNTINSKNDITTEKGSTIKSNDSTRTTGGGIDAYNSKLEIKNTNINSNSSETGGGIFIDYLSSVDVINSTLAYNNKNNIGIVSSASISIKYEKDEIKQEKPTTDKDNNSNNDDDKNKVDQDEKHDEKDNNGDNNEKETIQYVKKDDTIASGTLPQTGTKIRISIIIALIIITLYSIIKVYKNRDI